MNQTVYSQRIERLRQAMRDAGVEACIVLSSDPHLSEYLPEHWQARAWLSGFEGSAGTLVVTAGFAGLWTDSRYWEQAEHDLAGSGISAMRAGAPDVPDHIEWLAQNLAPGARISVDGRALSVRAHRQWEKTLEPSGLQLLTSDDLIARVWDGRPALPAAPVFFHEPPFACRRRADNLAAVRRAMRSHGADHHLISALDDIAWLLNLRGGDVMYNPVFLAHVLIDDQTVRLFIDPAKVGPTIRDGLCDDGVEIHSYERITDALAEIPPGQSLLIDPGRSTVGVLQSAHGLKLIEALNPAQKEKSRKTEAEIEHIRRTMEQDGAALCHFFAWFEQALEQKVTITELLVDEKITAARASRENFVSPSFSTIAAYNANGAMPHYQATPGSYSAIDGDGLLLIDSGGQYLGGTTDITRVVPVGTPSTEQMRDYTDVLKGMIALSMAIFPAGLPSSLLDPIARMPLWAAGTEYGHGTGHGVGYFLNVHEGPQSISYRAPVSQDMAMEAGMVTSNEPGLYRPGKWGVRIENLVVNQPAMTTEFGDFLKFETLTLCPIDTRCIQVQRLTDTERTWLNEYHDQVRERLLPLVDGLALQWLLARTEPL